MSSHRQSDTYRSADRAGKQRLDKVAALSPMDRCLYFVEEREKVRLAKKAKKPKPWTVDPILSRYRFCCPRRMDDKVSQWLLKNWYVPYLDHPNMLLAVVLARHFNLPSCLEQVGFPKKWNPDKLVKVLTAWKAKGHNLFNGAYMIRSSSNSSPRFYPAKHEMVIRETVQQFVDNPPELDTDNMRECVETICTYRNFGTFMAGQVVADLRWAITGNWKDRNTWAAIGPGSRRGFNRLHERNLKYPLKQREFLTELRAAMKEAKEKLPKSITSRLEAIDYQNIMGCEFDKYERTIHNESRPKQKYPGAA